MIGIVIALVFIIGILVIYNMSLNKRIQDFKNLHQKVKNLDILQDFVNIAGNEMTVENKIKAINDIIIEKYEVKYSTIVVFDGTDYVIKATNVDRKHWDSLTSLQEQDIFKDSISSTNPKYITINNDQEKLPYQNQEFGRAKSAVFFPLYIDNVYIGYWLIESGTAHDFDNIDITIFDSAKENIVTIMQAVDYQKTLESIVRVDLFSGLKSAEYLYGEGKKRLDKYAQSAICMFKIANIEEINEISRELGNQVITKVSEYVAKSISDEYLFVRYMGPKFAIAFCGVDTDSSFEFVSELKENTEKLKIKLNNYNYNEDDFNNSEYELDENQEDEINTEEKIIEVSPILNFAISNYYKGTGIENVLQKLEEYIDEDDDSEGGISNI